MPTTIRIPDDEDSPLWYRDRDVSFGRGKGTTVADEVAERLLAEHAFIVEACGVEQDDGSYCTRDPVECRYHAGSDPADADADSEPEPDTTDDEA